MWDAYWSANNKQWWCVREGGRNGSFAHRSRTHTNNEVRSLQKRVDSLASDKEVFEIGRRNGKVVAFCNICTTTIATGEAHQGLFCIRQHMATQTHKTNLEINQSELLLSHKATLNNVREHVNSTNHQQKVKKFGKAPTNDISSFFTKKGESVENSGLSRPGKQLLYIN